MSKQHPAAVTEDLYGSALRRSFAKLDPRALVRSPVIAVTALVALLVTALGGRDASAGTPGAWTSVHIAAWL